MLSFLFVLLLGSLLLASLVPAPRRVHNYFVAELAATFGLWIDGEDRILYALAQVLVLTMMWRVVDENLTVCRTTTLAICAGISAAAAFMVAPLLKHPNSLGTWIVFLAAILRLMAGMALCYAAVFPYRKSVLALFAFLWLPIAFYDLNFVVTGEQVVWFPMAWCTVIFGFCAAILRREHSWAPA